MTGLVFVDFIFVNFIAFLSLDFRQPPSPPSLASAALGTSFANASSVCPFNHSLKAAVKEAVNKVLSEPIRLHFAIASIATFYEPDIYNDDVFSEYAVEKARDLITEALGTHVPVIVNCSSGTIGRDAVSDEFKESQPNLGEEGDSILLIVGFLPGLKVTTIPLLKQIQEPEAFMID